MNILGTVIPTGVNMVGETAGEWQEIDMAVDSGATETVVSEEMLPGVPTQPREAFKKGVQYEVPSGTLIPNEGEKRFRHTVVGEQSEQKRVTAQVCDVSQGLLSVSKAVTAGNRVVFDAEETGGSYIQNKVTGEVTRLKPEGGMYTLKMWVKRAQPNQAKTPFQWPGIKVRRSTTKSL